MSFLKKHADYILNFLTWFCFSLILGVICAITGTLFHHASDLGAHLFKSYPFILFALPFVGVIIVFLYKIAGFENDPGTGKIIDAARNGDKISIKIAPLILISTALTHLCGGSAGREGAALQIGGSIASFFASIFKLKNYDRSVLIMCGMSGLFSAVFGTPVTAAIFAIEVLSVGIMRYNAIFPALISAVTAQFVSSLFGVKPTSFAISEIPLLQIDSLIKVLLLAILTSLLSIVFVTVLHETSKFSAKYISNKYLKIIIGALTIIVFTLVLNTYDYNGTGMPLVISAIQKGYAPPCAFILKMLFTAITLSAGFKGGEIVPTFCVGATFGVFMAPLLGLSPSFAASIGLIALFCAVVNCPIASVILSIELFGSDGLIFFSIAAITSYFLSGNFSLYSTQEFFLSRTSDSKEQKVFVKVGD